MKRLERHGLAGISAILLSLALASPASATTWDPVVSWNGWVDPNGLITFPDSSAVFIFRDQDHDVFIRRRTADATWLPRQRIGHGSFATAAGSGSGVNAVWIDRHRIRHKRSTDGGASFPFSGWLSPSSFPRTTAIARRGNLVVVVWDDQTTGDVNVVVRVSADGGHSFGPPTYFDADPTGASYPAVAIGNGVIYVSWFTNANTLVLRKSTNGGAGWGGLLTIASNATRSSGTGYLTAAGDRAFIAFAAQSPPDEFGQTNKWIRYRRTSNRGVLWNPATDLEPPLHAGGDSYGPVVAFQSGIVRAAWSRCGYDPGCGGNPDVVYRRQTVDGWSAIETVGGGEAAAVGLVEKTLVVFQGNPVCCPPVIRTRTGSP